MYVLSYGLTIMVNPYMDNHALYSSVVNSPLIIIIELIMRTNNDLTYNNI